MSNRHKGGAALFALGFGVLGTVLLFVSHAANPAAGIEVEAGQLANGAQSISDSQASAGQALKFGSVSQTRATGVLPIPSPLTTDWTAPVGDYTLPAQNINIDRQVKVDLTGSTITGTTGYLFNLQNGGRLTVVGGSLSGAFSGLVLDSVADGSTGGVSVSSTHLTGVKSVVFAKNQGGPIDISFTNVVATGLGAGIRATANVMDVESSTLTGGGSPPSGNPAGIHSLDDNAGNVAVVASTMRIFDSTITGYTSTGFQGDSILGETRVNTADVENNILGHNTDSGGIDSKMHSVIFRNNTIYSDGDRAISSHYGSLTASGNTIYQVASSSSGNGRAYQGTGTLVASNDKVILQSGAKLAVGDVVLSPGSGPPSTYPRVGNLTITHATDQNGTVLTGPTVANSGGSYRATVTVNP